MRAGTPFRLLLVGLAGVLTLPLVLGVVALRGPAPGAHAAAGDPTVIATIRIGRGGCPDAVAANPITNRIYVANLYFNYFSFIDFYKI